MALKNALNDYFEKGYFKDKKTPSKWFRRYENVLNGLESSYEVGNADNVAVHCDLCSPLVTNPTFGKLNRNIQCLLVEGYRERFQEMLGNLEPDIILIAVGKDWLNYLRQGLVTIKGELEDGWQCFDDDQYKKMGVDEKVQKQFRFRIIEDTNRKTLIGLGRNLRGSAFGGSGNDELALYGKYMKRIWNRKCKKD